MTRHKSVLQQKCAMPHFKGLIHTDFHRFVTKLIKKYLDLLILCEAFNENKTVYTTGQGPFSVPNLPTRPVPLSCRLLWHKVCYDSDV